MRRLGALAVAGAVLVLGGSLGYAQAPAPKYTNAEVVKIRAQERLLVIRNNDGVEQTVQLDDQVAGLADIKPGDQVILTLHGDPGRPRVASIAKAEAASRSGVRPARGVARPAAPVPAVADETDAEVRASGDEFEQRVANLAQEAIRVDSLWNTFRTSCNVTMRAGTAYEASRQWLSLWDSAAQVDLSSGQCRDLYNQIVGLGQAVSVGMADAEDQARRTLSPGQVRDIERRHQLEWGSWGRGAPELRDHR
jgi:hypothetical protein